MNEKPNAEKDLKPCFGLEKWPFLRGFVSGLTHKDSRHAREGGHPI